MWVILGRGIILDKVVRFSLGYFEEFDVEGYLLVLFLVVRKISFLVLNGVLGSVF